MQEDKFLMWRTAFCIIHLDKKIEEKERSWAEQKLNSLDLTKEQKKILESDLVEAKDFDMLFSKIQEPANRAFVLHMIRVVGNIDGKYDLEEVSKFKGIEKKILDTIELGFYEQKIKEMNFEENDSNIFERMLSFFS